MSRTRKLEFPKYKGKKKGSDLKFCSCRYCKFGLHHGGWGMFVAKYRRHAVRHAVKIILRKHMWDIDEHNIEEEIAKVKVGVTYTD